MSSSQQQQQEEEHKVTPEFPKGEEYPSGREEDATTTTQSSFAAWEFAQGPFHGKKGFLVTSLAPGSVIHAAKEAAKVLNDTYFSMSYNAHRIQGERAFKEAVPMYIDQCDSALFVALKPDDTDANPALLAKAILEEAAEGTWAKVEHVCRIIPIENCADSAEYEKLADEVVPLHFPKKEVPDPEKRKTFEVRFEQHCPAEGKHDEARSKKIVELFAARVPEETYKVNLSNPQSTVLVVECGKTFFCGVVDDYEGKMKKCNVREFKKAEKEHHHEAAAKET
ncbi:unnamed protein product [Bathycoccus prasinos]